MEKQPEGLDEKVLSLEAAMNEPLPDEEALLKSEDLSSDSLDLLAVGLRLLRKAAEEKPEVVKELVAKAGVGYAKATAESTTSDTDVSKTSESSQKGKEESVTADTEALLKQRDEQIAKLREDNEQLRKAAAQFEEFRKAVLEKEDDRAVDELIAKYALPGDREKLRSLLKSLNAEQRAAWVESQKAGLEALRRLEKEIGTSARASAPAADNLVRAVNERLAKAETPLRADVAGVQQVLKALHDAADNDPTRIREMAEAMRQQDFGGGE